MMTFDLQIQDAHLWCILHSVPEVTNIEFSTSISLFPFHLGILISNIWQKGGSISQKAASAESYLFAKIASLFWKQYKCVYFYTIYRNKYYSLK